MITRLLFDGLRSKITWFLFDGARTELAGRALLGSEVEFLLGKGGNLVGDGAFIGSIGWVIMVGIVGEV